MTTRKSIYSVLNERQMKNYLQTIEHKKFKIKVPFFPISNLHCFFLGKKNIILKTSLRRNLLNFSRKFKFS